MARTIVRVIATTRKPSKCATELGPAAAHVLKHVTVSGAVPWKRLQQARFVATTVDIASSWIFGATYDADGAKESKRRGMGGRASGTVRKNSILRALDFDYVVVDEASQVRLGQLLPLLLSTYMANHAAYLRSR